MLGSATLGEKQPVEAHWLQKKTQVLWLILSLIMDPKLSFYLIFHLWQNLSEIHQFCRQLCPLNVPHPPLILYV